MMPNLASCKYLLQVLIMLKSKVNQKICILSISYDMNLTKTLSHVGMHKFFMAAALLYCHATHILPAAQQNHYNYCLC